MDAVYGCGRDSKFGTDTGFLQSTATFVYGLC